MTGKDERKKEGQIESGVSPVPINEPMMGIGGEIGIKVEDVDGNLIKQFTQPMKTFVENASSVIMCGFLMACDAAPGFAVQDVLGEMANVFYVDQVGAGDYCVEAAANNDNFGILVGTSSVVWAWSQYLMQGKISHGTGANQLSYGETVRSFVGGGGAPATCTVTRSFDNATGAEAIVREIGWFLTALRPTAKYFMIARDVISATAIPNGGRLTVTYNIKINPT